MRVRFLLLPLLLGLGLCGCATIQDYQYNLVQRCRADSAYKESYGLWSSCSRDYQDGWKQGYFDLSTGQCEEAPATPPHKYWDAKYQSLDGHAAVDEWYSGWQDGATAAIEDGRPHFHPVVASPTAPVNPYGRSAFQCSERDFEGPEGVEAMPPVLPTHDPQPQVHIGPAPQKFASQSITDDELLDDESLGDESRDELLDNESLGKEPLEDELLDGSALPSGNPADDLYYSDEAAAESYE